MAENHLHRAGRVTATVSPLRPAAVTASFAPVPELIEELEKLLAQAKSDKMRAAAWAVVLEEDAKPDGAVSGGWARGSYTSFALTAAIERLTYYWKKHEWGV